MKLHPSLLLTAALALLALPARAQVPGLLNYQGKVAIGEAPFTGTGLFKFALVDTTGTVTYWSNDGTSVAGSEPATAVSRPVANGIYSLLLGDTTIPHMSAAVPVSVFTHNDVRLRVWFNDGTHGSELLAPDQRIAAVGYALMAASAQTVPDGSITAAKLAPGVTPGGGGGTAWSSTSGTTQVASANGGYIAANPAQTVYTLPTDATIGATVRIVGAGAGGFKAVAGSGQVLSPGTLPATVSGLTWNVANLDPDAPFSPDSPEKPMFSSTDGSHLLMFGYPGTLYSANGGATWAVGIFPDGAGDEIITTLSTATGDFSKVYVPVYNYPGTGNTGTQTSLLESIDGGATFAPSAIVLPGGLDADGSLLKPLQVTADGSGMWVLGYFGSDPDTGAADNRLYSSSNSGATWTRRNLPPEIEHQLDPNSPTTWSFVGGRADGAKLILSGYDVDYFRQSFFSTVDYGATWTALPVPLPDADFDPSASIEGLLASADMNRFALFRRVSDYFTGQDVYTVVTSYDAGATWTTHLVAPSDGSGAYGSLTASDDLLAMAVTAYDNNSGQVGVRASIDGGTNWSALALPESPSFSYTAASLRITPTGGHLVFENLDAGQILSTVINATGNYAVIGAQWASVEFIYLGNGQWAPITVTGTTRAQ